MKRYNNDSFSNHRNNNKSSKLFNKNRTLFYYLNMKIRYFIFLKNNLSMIKSRGRFHIEDSLQTISELSNFFLYIYV